jgi:hypothetical protein
MTRGLTDDYGWAQSLDVLERVPAIGHKTAALLEQAEQLWRGKVKACTSMTDLIFTRPDDPFPWQASVRASYLFPNRGRTRTLTALRFPP